MDILSKVAQILHTTSANVPAVVEELLANRVELAKVLKTSPGNILGKAREVMADRDLMHRTCDRLLGELEKRVDMPPEGRDDPVQQGCKECGKLTKPGLTYCTECFLSMMVRRFHD